MWWSTGRIFVRMNIVNMVSFGNPENLKLYELMKGIQP